jgi:hypothetical protein
MVFPLPMPPEAPMLALTMPPSTGAVTALTVAIAGV